MNQIVDVIRKNPRLQRLLWKGKFGLEIERLRIDSEGKLALTPHPPGLGNKSEHPYITTDFSESQLEMISPPLDSIDEAHGFIKTLHNVVRGELAPGELLWPQSMPPILPPDDQIPLARFDGDARGGTEYRQYLSETYGRARQTISGGHFNLSFLPEFFEVLSAETAQPIEELKEQVYLKIVRNLMRHRWFLVGLLGRSPLSHESLRLKSLDAEEWLEVCCAFGASIRCSRIGYRNREQLGVDYSSIKDYNASVQRYVAEGKLLNSNELYLPVRAKQVPGTDEISHIEIRVIDLDPFDAAGVDPASLRMAHLFLMDSLLIEEEGEFDFEAQKQADERQNEIACWAYVQNGTQCGKPPPSFPFGIRRSRALRRCEQTCGWMLRKHPPDIARPGKVSEAMSKTPTPIRRTGSNGRSRRKDLSSFISAERTSRRRNSIGMHSAFTLFRDSNFPRSFC